MVFPLAGKGLRLADAGYELPKPLVEVSDKTILEWSVRSLELEGDCIFCCKKEHIENYKIDELIQKISPKSNIISIDYETRGTVETILEARKLIDNDEELLISDTDHYLLWNPDNFNKKIRTQNIDACVMVFPEPMSTTTASYLKLNEDNYVIEAAEKNPISTIASVGVHYFKKGSDFVKYSNQMIESNISYKNEFYVTPVYNFMVKDNKKIITSPIKKMWPLGSDKEIQKFIQEFPNSKSIQNNNGEENYE